MPDEPIKISLRHNPVADYLRERPHFPVTKGIRLAQGTLRSLRRRLASRPVPLDRLLCGGEGGLSAAQYARHTGDLLRPSTPFARSPHVQLLEEYLRVGEEIFRPEVFRRTAYFANAVECMSVMGAYFTCTREDQVEQIARGFVARFRGETGAGEAASSEPDSPFSPPGWLIRVRPVQFSDCYEVVDGNHRLAIAYVRGARTARAKVLLPSALTPLQQLLTDYAWCANRGVREIYQPVSSPELGDQWTLIRRCADRFEMIRRFLEEHHLMPPRCATYLDVACSYGWFVREFGGLGFRARGAEIDWAAVEIGRLVYGLKPCQVTRSEVVRFLRNDPGVSDVVSCFSLLHHFVMGRASVSAEELLRLLDRATKTVLFFDMGQEHEAWFRESLSGWNPDRIEQWLRDHSSFTKVYRLGTDSDNVAPFADNYGRTLFACMR